PAGVAHDAVTTTTGLEASLDSGHGDLSLSTVRQKQANSLLERLVDHVVLAEAAKALARLLLHPVVTATLRAPDPAGAGDLEALGSGAVRLHFRHWCLASRRKSLGQVRAWYLGSKRGAAL